MLMTDTQRTGRTIRTTLEALPRGDIAFAAISALTARYPAGASEAVVEALTRGVSCARTGALRVALLLEDGQPGRPHDAIARRAHAFGVGDICRDDVISDDAYELFTDALALLLPEAFRSNYRAQQAAGALMSEAAATLFAGVDGILAGQKAAPKA